MSRFGAPSPKTVIEKAAANDSSVTSINLSGNALFMMKTFEYGNLLADALAGNTFVVELILSKSGITNADCEWLCRLLETNKSVTSLDLEGNKIDSQGGVKIANGIEKNSTLTHLNLLNQGPFGEGCMDAWLQAFTQNIILSDLKWRLDSRKSFKLSKDLIRNKSIAKAKMEGKDWNMLLPDHLRAPVEAVAAAAKSAAE
ncbi:hypothetical protein M885DRAFT_510152 [Pelagophyceae sp. CCMP2097]|nr:hypothetical protein M885DRAFT_510152 [Pelagophyceae sp. CCMP2097]|mmetsp:Transcript_11254/g.37572  ORF Transcript_11254/g.37572 Transcript_11254/m.37572 type:complete len:200 (-) Transcript_11254:171-770(-)